MRAQEFITEIKGCGDCFEVAGRAMITPEVPEIKLVHAYVTGQGPVAGKRFSHAWNEIGDVVLDYSNGRRVVMRKPQYYELGQISTEPGEYATYNDTEAKKKMVQTRHWGPWDLDPTKERITEVNSPDELTISDRIQDYFFDRGYSLAGEGRDQMAFESPRGTIVKVLGTGETEREDIVKNYVKFFQRNQHDPYYPRIYNAGDFTIDNETYFVYEMEYLTYVSDEEEVLEYIEDLMSTLAQNGARGVKAFQKNRSLPDSLPAEDVAGLVKSTHKLEAAIGGQAPLDLSMIENIRRREDGHLVIMDPYSL